MADEKQPLEPKELRTVETERQLCIVRFSPDGKLLCGGGYDRLIRRWDFSQEEPAELPPIDGHEGWVQRMAFHPGGRLLFVADSWGQLKAWPYAEEKPEAVWSVPEAHDGWIRSLAPSEDGSKLVTGSRDQHVRVWSAKDGQLLHDFAGHEYAVFAVAIHPDGKSVVSADLMGNVRHWDLATGKTVRTLEVPEMHYYDRDQDVAGLYLLGFHDGGKTLVCAGSEPNRAGRAYGIPTVRLYDWGELELQHKLQHGEAKQGFVFDYAWRPEGFFAIVTSGTPGSGQLLFHRPGEDEPFFVHTKLFNCHSLSWHPDGKRFVVAATNRRSQGNGAVTDKEGNYLGNSSPLHVFEALGTAG